ncbi:MAG TPA: glucose-6-phosphate isomerase [Candidatus Hydrogenedentes bacterium]|nr:glucose-6-phosphate isomerase [Candidatus Hydrogenedentota bacterium]HIJ73419.1 glucose-6-phosphate isomerase [Candidatus Hydrogenedentota bacterium]
MNTDIRIDISRATSAAVGQEHGITPAELREIAPRVESAHAILQDERRQGVYGFYDLYKDQAALSDVKATADHFASLRYDNLVVLGIGGSALGATALATALKPPYYNALTKRARKGCPRLFVMDNIDPVTFRQMMRLCPPQKTLYNVISKSGGTAETMAQLMIVIDLIERKLGAPAAKDHIVVTTNPRGNDAPPSHLHPVADQYGLKEFVVPLNVGGRFSVFSPVGMFPAAVLGLDLDAMVAGCAAMDARCSKPGIKDNPAYLRAAVQYLADTRKGKVMSVMMPYADALRDVADWYRQLWAESLGKRHDLDGDEVYTGQTPIRALGATDQHSQIQLYREGPNNKLINVIEVRRFANTLRIPDVLHGIAALDYVRGKSMNKLMAAELRGTIDALRSSARPVTRIILPRINAHSVAQLLYMLEVETAMAGRLYNVQTFDQPGVEEGKRIARRLMGGSA